MKTDAQCGNRAEVCGNEFAWGDFVVIVDELRNDFHVYIGPICKRDLRAALAKLNLEKLAKAMDRND